MKSIFAFIMILALSTTGLAQEVFVNSTSDIYDGETVYGPVSAYAGYEKVDITINGNKVKSLDDILINLGKALNFPRTYGKNLDALRDLLSDSQVISQKTTITITSGNLLNLTLGEEDSQALLEVLNESQEKNSQLTVWYWQ